MTKPKGSMPERQKRGNETSIERTLRMLREAKRKRVEVKPGLFLQQVRR